MNGTSQKLRGRVRQHPKNDVLFRFSYALFKIEYVILKLFFLAMSLYGIYKLGQQEFGFGVGTTPDAPTRSTAAAQKDTRPTRPTKE